MMIKTLLMKKILWLLKSEPNVWSMKKQKKVRKEELFGMV